MALAVADPANDRVNTARIAVRLLCCKKVGVALPLILKENTMSLPSILSNSLFSQVGNSNFSQRRTDFRQLAAALQSGDLAGAQKAFSQLQSDMGTNNPNGTDATSSGSNPFQNLIGQIGSALQSGNLSAAQQALADFRNHAASAAPEAGGGPGGPGSLLDAIFQALSQSGVSGTSANNASSSTSTPAASSSQDPLQALGAFMHDLFAALQAQGGPATQSGQPTTAKGGSDSDGDNDGSANASVSGPSEGGHHHHRGGGLEQLESKLQSLIQQMSASASSSSATGSTTATNSTSSTSTLQQSYQELLNSLGLSGNSSTLGSFLQALSQNLQGLGSSGNVVSTRI